MHTRRHLYMYTHVNEWAYTYLFASTYICTYMYFEYEPRNDHKTLLLQVRHFFLPLLDFTHYGLFSFATPKKYVQFFICYSKDRFDIISTGVCIR